MTASERFCDIWELARRRGTLQGELALGEAPRLAGQLADTAGLLRFRIDGLVDRLSRPAAALEVQGRVRARCDRCGGPVEIPIDERAQFFLVTDERELGRLPVDESPEEPLLGSHRFDVVALVEDQAILALPISPRHDDCAGPMTSTAAAGGGETHRPFAALVALKKPRP